MMDWTEFILCNLYGIPLFILYTRIIYVLRTNRQIYSSAFYKFVVVSGVVDCCGYWLNQIFNRWPSAPLLGDVLLFFFSTPSYYLTLPYMCTFYSMYLVHMSAFLLALNRISSLFIPLSYEKVWRDHFHWLLLFYFAVPFFICFHLLASPTYVSTESPSHFFSYVQVLQGAFFGISMRLRSLTFFLITASLTFLVNLTSLLYLACRQKVAKVTQDTQTRLFVFTIALFGCHILLVAEQCLYVYAGYVDKVPWIVWITSQYPFFCDLTTLAPAILLLATSTKLRGHVFRPLRRFLLTLLGVEASSKTVTIFVSTYKTKTNF